MEGPKTASPRSMEGPKTAALNADADVLSDAETKRMRAEALRSGVEPPRPAALLAGEPLKVTGARVVASPDLPRPTDEGADLETATPVAESVEASTWTPLPAAGEPEIQTEAAAAVRGESLGGSGGPLQRAAGASESDERLRAAETSEPEVEVARSLPPADVPDIEDAGRSASTSETESEEHAHAIEALEPDDRAPVSSRRPVALAADDHLAQMAFGEESSTPHHTPPPESGRLPSASVEEFDDATGIRGAHVEETGRKVISHLQAEATRPNLQRSELVVDAVGEARHIAPATFLELLQASLEL